MTEHRFRVARKVQHSDTSPVMGMSDKVIDYPLVEGDHLMYVFMMPDRSEFGVQLNGDGTFAIGSWTPEGEWVELVLTEGVGLPPFNLAAFQRSLTPAVRNYP